MTTPGFLPTHVVPPGGLPAWEAPDPARPTVPLDALLPVQVLDRLGDWGQVLCANGWSAWVDGRLLVAVPQAPPAAGTGPTRTADPRPLLARAEEALTRYRTEAEALAAGRLDGGDFRDRMKGLRIGVVVDGDSLWLFDAAHERWVYCDGTRLSTFAVAGDPQEDPAPPAEPTRGPAPTRVVGERGPAEPAPEGRGRADTAAEEHGRADTTAKESGRADATPVVSGRADTAHAVRERTEGSRPGRQDPGDHEPTRLVRPVTPDE
ncbi:hypothetical protein [Streptomyces heilongjiangensis]|uniref:Uncharacterized protein n=1 Tax=Streptomyces heilongjiangensis TaxID=945052 RepID=A0ABW1B8B9_9ACTN|nr:hypothetical protein [Streptomyces heilongjiangensis]MDC2947458.1 hypothetical protein [Streptomyces heilongjiangensis]